MAMNHSVALNLENRDIKQMFEAGDYDPDKDTPERLQRVTQSRNGLYSSLCKSLLVVVVALLVALGVSYLLGHIDFALPFSGYKMLWVVSTSLLTWSALFKLGWGLQTCSGEALHEVMYDLIFKLLFACGSVLAFVAILIG